MFSKLFLHSLRNLRRQKSYVIINLAGLAIGIACSLIIALYIFNELSYDKFHVNRDNIYRVILNGKLGEQEIQGSYTPSPLGEAMVNEFPEVECFTRFMKSGPTTLRYENQSFIEENFVEVDSGFFQIFSFQLLKGDPDKVLNEPNLIVLSESTARKIFGDDNPIGKMIKVGTTKKLYSVSGIMADFPENSHVHANALGSFVTSWRANDRTWLSNSFSTYVLLNEASSGEQVNERFPEMVKKYIGPELFQIFGATLEDFEAAGNKYNFYLQNLLDIHFNTEIQHDAKPPTDPKYLMIFGIIAVFIIIIAGINFMNLSTAQASKRAKEVGMKKVSGSSRSLLIIQFIFESVILSFIALLIALLLIKFSLPYLNNIIGAKLELSSVTDWYLIPVLLLFIIVVGLIAGSYPAFYLSSFKPVYVLKSAGKSSGSGRILRSGLVVIQFSISIILIVGTLIMSRQIRFMLNKDLGFHKENVLVIDSAHILGNKVSSFKEELKKYSEVINVSASTAVPGHNNNTNGYTMEGRRDETFLLETNRVDYDFLDTYGFKVQEGRFFDEDYPSDKDACLINMSAVSHFGLEEPVGTIFLRTDGEELMPMPVVGVFNDFHFRSLADPIQPYVFRFKNENVHWGYISIRLQPESNHSTIKKIEQLWLSFAPEHPMQYFFLEDSLIDMYQNEKRNSAMAVIFSVFGLLVAALGLFGLTSFTVEQKTKEIGIRKALGSSGSKIFILIVKEILFLVLLASLIGAPIIYFLSDNWLRNYYYRIDPGILDFVPGILIGFIIATITVSYRTIRAAGINPAHSLRYE